MTVYQLVAAAATPSPNPTPGLRDGLDESIISPGLAGFLAVFGIALVAVLLFYSLTSKLRRVKVRGAVEDERAARAQATGADDAGPTASDDDAGPGVASEGAASEDAGAAAPGEERDAGSTDRG